MEYEIYKYIKQNKWIKFEKSLKPIGIQIKKLVEDIINKKHK